MLLYILRSLFSDLLAAYRFYNIKGYMSMEVRVRC